MPNNSFALIRWLFLSLLALSTAHSAFAAEKTSFNLGHSNDLAMDGYDVMSYWQGGKPVKGDEQYRYEYGGATWLFVSQQHLETFASSPAKYAPQFGGHCAYAASRGYLADVDPFAWRIWDKQLYLNYSPGVQRMWAGSIDANITKGNDNWPRIDPAVTGVALD